MRPARRQPAGRGNRLPAATASLLSYPGRCDMPERDLECIDDNVAGAFIEGRLPADEVSALERHLDRCTSCRERLSVLAQLRSRSLATGSPGAEGAAAMPDGAPDGSIERYLIVEVLGAGAMGVVYAAYDPQLRRRVDRKSTRLNSSHVSE